MDGESDGNCKSGSSEQGLGEWSDEFQRHYKARKKADGSFEYQHRETSTQVDSNDAGYIPTDELEDVYHGSNQSSPSHKSFPEKHSPSRENRNPSSIGPNPQWKSSSAADLKRKEQFYPSEQATVLFPIEYQENRYQKKLASIYGNSKSKSTPGMSLLEVALLKCVASDSGTGYCTITYELTWELPSFLEKFFPAKQPLGSILTLTGGPVDAYESSCKDYLTNTFPDIGPYMLECLERTLIGSDAIKNTPLPSGICAVDFRHRTRSDSFVSTSTASCKVVANFTTHVQIALLLSWLCAAVRSSDHAGLSLSSVSVDGGLKTNVGRSLSIGIAPLEHVKSGGTCWHELFHHGIIAKDFPIPSRSFGRGLEIPFSDMALLCGCLGFVEYKSGFVVDGLTSILIPRKKLLEGEDDAFQWHFESKIRDEGRIAYTTDVLEKVDMEPWGNGNSDVLRDDLINKRCFLAWAERCTIMVGTEKHFNSTTIDDSHAKVSASTKHVRAYGLNLGGNVSHLPFGATMNLTPTSMPAFFKPSISNGIRDILTIEKTQNKGNHFVLVYDTEAKIGWYLPQACVVLYMVHHYLSEQRLDLIDAENQETSLEFAEQDGFTNVGPRAASILYKNLGCRTQRCLMSNPTRAKQAGMLSASSSITSTSTIYEHCQFKDTIERLWYLLDTVGSTLKTNQSEYMKCSESTPHGLHGVDFKELLAAKGPERFTSIRYVKIEQPWSYLTNDQSTVLFCKNFGQAIVPASKGLCEVWSKVPQKEGFLAMTGRTIHYFLEKHQSGLSKELKWLSKKPLIQGHHLPEHSSVVHTQLLKEKGGASLAKIKDKISRTTSGGDLSNDQLIEAISPQSCLLFAVQQGKQCTSPAINAGCEEILKPADAIEAPAFLASIHSNLRNQQEKYNRDSTVVEHANLKLISIRKKHASVSSSESSGSKDFSLANRDSGHQPRQESTKDYSYGLGARGRLGEDEFRDETQEQSKPLMPLHPQPPHTFLTLGLDSLKDGDQPSFTLEQQRDPMQEHDEQNSQSPNFISESGPRSNGVTSSGS